jgi:sterol desaturase/sphingolipid hydroxylase (fatty acid hydroxylase superfamily)
MFKYILAGVLAGVLDYYIIQFFYYWFHRFIHLPCSGIFYKLHYIGHHKRDFPIRRLRSDTYSADGSSGWFNTGGELVFLIPITMLSGCAYWLLSLDYFFIFEFVLLGNIIIGEFLHSSYHLSNNATTHPESLIIHKKIVNYSWFCKLQYLHDLHHAYKTANFGFFDMTMDKLFGTYEKITPNHLLLLNNDYNFSKEF